MIHRCSLGRLITLVCALVLVFLPATAIWANPAHAQANTIQSIDIDVLLQPDGSAKVTENRKFTANEGTEHYLPFENLGESEITDFYVTENGQRLQEQTPWNVNGTIEEKAGKYGVNRIGGGVELCFGIGQLGSREFTIYYRITNFVRMLEDGNQAIYWQFLHAGMDKTEHVRINVRSPEGFEFVYPDTKLWGFGFDGQTEIRPQALHMSTTTFTRSSRAVMLAILPPNTVNTSASYPYDSTGIEAKAKEGSVWEDRSDGGSGTSIQYATIIALMIAFVFSLFMPFIIFFLLVRYLRNRTPAAYGFRPTSRDIEHTTQMPPYDPFALAALYRHSPDNMVKACVIKWILEGAFVQEDYERNFVFWSVDEKGLRVAGTPRFFSDAERRLFDHFRTAAGHDGLLEQSEITKHFKNNQREFTDWCEEVRIASQHFLKRQGLIREIEKGVIFRRRAYEPTDQGQALIDQMEGFRNYLRDGWYPEAAPNPEMHMMWAAFLDALDRAKDRLGPAFIYASQVDSVNRISNSARSGYTPSGSSSGSSGGGGSSSFGGGGGASGASSGGGTR